jgi:lipopolysaccharide/colanic/teichoic acid biosynthesis glycosyltransferase
MLKRLFDVLSSSAGLMVLLPLMLAIAVAVELDSPGGIFFRQIRVGRGGRTFSMYKFRSMRGIPDHNGPLITRQGDPRITRVGAFLRRTKLDELPQLINVLRGDMSLVGPRPEVPRYIEMYPAELRHIVLSVRPGITDEASIEFRDEEALLASASDAEAEYVREILPRKIDMYVRYVRNRTFIGDLRILLRTLRRISRRS